MWSHIEVQNLAPPVLDDEEAVEQLERYRRYSEEIERDDHLAVILEKGKPAPPGSARRRIRCRYRATVRSQTAKPSFCSSPWILGAPQSGFSSARRRIRTRTSSAILGRPLPGRERQRQAPTPSANASRGGIRCDANR